MIEAIYTSRVLDLVSCQVVYEWEDILSLKLKAPLKHRNNTVGNIAKCIFNKNTYNYISNKHKYINTDNTMIAFLMCIQDSRYFLGKNNVLPIIIDLWEHELDLFCKIFNESKLVYLSSLEAVNEVNKINGVKPHVKFLPMSISDMYNTDVDPVKEIDIIQIGRSNPVFNEYVGKLLKKYPDLNYVYKKLVGDKFYWFSTTRGELGEMDTRREYMDLLSNSRISLVSSPGMDDVRDTGKFDPVTPRFLESAASRCHMLGRYPDNADYSYYKISDICNNITEYGQFEYEVMSLITTPTSILKDYYKDFIENNLTSKRVHQILDDLKVL